MTDSRTLLLEYIRHGSESAFRELVTRYIDLVYSTACRLVGGDIALAQDVTQTVFLDLSRMAKKLSGEVMLGGWLYQHTCYVACNTLRAERRRRAREREAVEMNALEDHSRANFARIAPYLDDAIACLEAEDRTAILLRFFEQRDFRSMGEALGSSADAARMRVNRALEKLHAILTHQGVTLSAAALGAALAAYAVTRAPAGLAANVSATVLANAASSASSASLAERAISGKVKVFLASAGAVIVLGTAVVIHRAQTEFHTVDPGGDLAAAAMAKPVDPGGNQVSAPRIPEPAAEGLTEAGDAPVVPPSPQVISAAGGPANLAPESLTNTPLELVWISPGKFMMGSLPAEPGRKENEGPPIEVRITQGFWLGKYEVTLAQFHALGAGPVSDLNEGDPEQPVLGISWEQATNFCSLLNRRERGTGRMPAGYAYRLPTEAEWEYACRAGSTTRFSSGNDGNNSGQGSLGAVAWYEANSQASAQRVGLKDPNPWGLHDMHGNVAEWCLDWLQAYPGGTVTNLIGTCSGPSHVLRGGNFLASADKCRSAARLACVSQERMMGAGFRVALARDPVEVNSTSTKPSATRTEGLVPLMLKLPEPSYKGIPSHLSLSPYVEPFSDKPRPPMLVPPGLQNIALGKRVTSSDKNATQAMLAKIVDGNKEATDESIVFLRKGVQWVQLDLGNTYELFAIVLWHAHNTPKVYHDVMVQVTDDEDFLENVCMLFNNDQDNTSGEGVGTDREYFETFEGRLINAKGTKARYLRFYSKGSTESALNEYTEIEVYGRPSSSKSAP